MEKHKFDTTNSYLLKEDHHTIIQALSEKINESPNELLSRVLELGIMFCVAVQKENLDLNDLRKMVKENEEANELSKIIYNGWDLGRNPPKQKPLK